MNYFIISKTNFLGNFFAVDLYVIAPKYCNKKKQMKKYELKKIVAPKRGL